MTCFELQVLGGIDLRLSEGDPGRILRQPKRLALLAYLVLARPRGPQPRDNLLAIFWPESDERRARNALSQALHMLRSDLGTDAVEGSGTQRVGLDHGAIRCDVLDFEAHMDAERFEAAFELYRGDLLPGLHVEGTVEFAHWLDLERDRLRRLARDAARKAAMRLKEKSPTLAAGTLRRALDIFPGDEHLFGLMAQILVEGGDRSGFEHEWRSFRRRRIERLGMAPSSTLESLVEDLRRSRPDTTGPPDPVHDTEGRPVRSVAVLPLMGIGTSAQYSSDGMTEALVSELGRVRSLRVISHQSVLRFKRSDRPLREIARILEVDALIEGSVLEAGGRVRVTAQLVRAEPEEHLWADAFEADAADVIGVHREVARAVANAVSAVLSEEEERQLRQPSPVEPAAFEAYLQGWRHLATLVPTRMGQALPLFEEAIRVDPAFALPRGCLAVSYWMMLITGEVPVAGNLDRVRELAESAVTLDPQNAMAHTAMSCLRFLSHDWEGGMESVVRAVSISPSFPMAYGHLCLANVLFRRFDEAFAAAEQARSLDPLAPYANFLVGWSLHYARRDDAAAAELGRVLRLFPDYPMASVFLAKARFQLALSDWTADACDRAISACDRVLELMPTSPMALGRVAHMQARLGDRQRAARTRTHFETAAEERGYRCPFYTAMALCGEDRIDEAFASLDRLDSEASGTAWLLPVDPLLDPLRDDDRFPALLARVGLDNVLDL